MDDTQSPLGERHSAPPAVEERIADEAMEPGADEVTVQMPRRAPASAGAAVSESVVPENAAEMAMSSASSTPGTLPSDEPTIPALPGSPAANSLPIAGGMPAIAPAAGVDSPTYPSLPVVSPTVYSSGYVSAPRRPSPSPLGAL